MKQHISVKQKNKITQSENVMAEGPCEVSDDELITKVSYHELDAMKTKVELAFDADTLTLVRHGEVQTTLHFKAKTKTIGTVLSEFGEFQVEIYTHRYLIGKDTIALEYDVLSGDEVSDTFRILWKLRRYEA